MKSKFCVLKCTSLMEFYDLYLAHCALESVLARLANTLVTI